jgi:hypothetical protein
MAYNAKALLSGVVLAAVPMNKDNQMLRYLSSCIGVRPPRLQQCTVACCPSFSSVFYVFNADNIVKASYFSVL